MGETVKGSFESVIDFGSGGVNRCRQYRFDFEDLTSQTFLLSLIEFRRSMEFSPSCYSGSIACNLNR